MPTSWRNKLILDNWAQFSFKPEFDADRAPEGAWLAPQWVGNHRRRLAAYRMLRAYRSNVARWYLSIQSEADLANRDERHEYGDVELLVQSISSALLGDEVRVGAAEEVDAPEEYLEWARGWAKDVRAVRKLTAAEDHAVGEGDGILVVGWDDVAQRPSLMPFDPGFYFPVLTDFTEEFPKKVHLAWALDPEENDNQILVRRITYELVSLDPENPEDFDTFDGRLYPWSDRPSNYKCVMSDGTWNLGDETSVDALSDKNAKWETTTSGEQIRNLDLGIDFIPVVHIPNTIADEEHYGVSSLASVLQLLDEISAAYTDLAKGAAIAGFPPLASEGATEVSKDGTIASYGPGTVFTGKLSTVDTSAGLRVLMDYIMFLLKLLNTNARVPEVLLGRVDPSNVPSGVAIRLMFTQLEMMIRRMRLVRDEKHPLVFKFAARFAMANGQLTPTADWPDITFIPGQFIPADTESLIQSVTAAYTAKLISIETAISMLMEAGLPIDSVQEEIDRIQARDYSGAQQAGLVDETLAFEHLGRPVPPPRDRRPEPPPNDDEP